MPTRADALQGECGEGPCIDEVWQEPMVMVPDLASETLWPLWAPRVVQELGVRSMLCVRLFTYEDRVAVLTMYADQPQTFTPTDEEGAIAIAAHAAVAVVTAEQIEQLELALHSRTMIGQATGLIMGRYEVDSSTAFQLLVRISNEENRKVSAIATQLVEQNDADPSRDLKLRRTRRRPPKKPRR